LSGHFKTPNCENYLICCNLDGTISNTTYINSNIKVTICQLIFEQQIKIYEIEQQFILGLLNRQIELPISNQLPIIAIAGVFDTGGNVIFALATRVGRLDVSAILSSLYPAITVLLAWVILKEKINNSAVGRSVDGDYCSHSDRYLKLREICSGRLFMFLRD